LVEPCPVFAEITFCDVRKVQYLGCFLKDVFHVQVGAFAPGYCMPQVCACLLLLLRGFGNYAGTFLTIFFAVGFVYKKKYFYLCNMLNPKFIKS
jgi:hypothetical protein